jgi:ABC-type Fe3+ transport system substrate-binding protein
VEEIPAFERLQANYADRKVRVVLVSTDFKRHVRSKVLPFVRERQLRSQVLFMDEPTPNKWIDLVSPDWTGALPATLLIGRQGKASVFFEKKLDYAELEAALLGILNE